MNRLFQLQASLCLGVVLLTAGCGGRVAATSAQDSDAGPPPAQVEQEQDGGAFSVDHPEQFPLATAGRHEAAPELNVTGTVSPDVSRNIPVVSLASGRVVDIHARLGDTVTKGQLLMRVAEPGHFPGIFRLPAGGGG